MSSVKEEVKRLDNYRIQTVEDIVKQVRDPEVELLQPAEQYFLRSLGLPVSYFRNASEELQTRMIVEAASAKKEERLRVVMADDDQRIIGLGPDLPSEIRMASFIESLHGEEIIAQGSLIETGQVYMFRKLEELDIDGHSVLAGYNVLLSQMFNKGLHFKPSLMVLICTNGLVDTKKSGREFSLSVKMLTKDYLDMTVGTIPGVVSGMSNDYTMLVQNAIGCSLSNPREYMMQLQDRREISKGLMQGGLKVLETLSEGLKAEDPAYPTSCETLWDMAQLLSYVARAYKNPTQRISAEVSIMQVLYSGEKQ